MNRSIRHRGPDDVGHWIEPGGRVAFGHVRLSILDLSPLGHQPMSTPDGAVQMVYNGEVYNFPSLRAELEALGHRFVSRSDSEVVLRVFQQWGTSGFQRLNGMFAAAFADMRTNRVYLVRDRLGIKPLHYWWRGGTLVFCSEIKGILASGRVPGEEDLALLHEFLFYGNTLGEGTFYKGVRRLEPGTFLEFDLEQRTVLTERYWSVSTRPPSNDTEDQAITQVRELLDASVRRQLASDVPVGVFLSGGIDSSAIAALAARHYPGRLRTYTVGFDYVADTDEQPTARAFASQLGTEHHELHVGATNLLDTLRRLVEAHDSPFSDAANVPLLQLCEALRGETKVILQGDGGDEVFGGYRRYEVLSLARLFRIAGMVGAAANALLPDSAARAARRRFLNAVRQRDPTLRMALLLTVEDLADSPIRVLRAEVRDAAIRTDPFRRYREIAADLETLDPVQAMLLTDLQIILPDIFLEKVDRSTMALSTEVRVPFLDGDLVDYVSALPSHLKVKWGQKKRLLRRALRGIVPDSILDAPKAGFGVPFGDWMRGPLSTVLSELAMGRGAPAASLFDEHELRLAIDQHAQRERDHGFLLWKCLQLALWREMQNVRRRA
jgi:asparagine synthase (glutamine-hydrolysing)